MKGNLAGERENEQQALALFDSVCAVERQLVTIFQIDDANANKNWLNAFAYARILFQIRTQKHSSTKERKRESLFKWFYVTLFECAEPILDIKLE